MCYFVRKTFKISNDEESFAMVGTESSSLISFHKRYQSRGLPIEIEVFEPERKYTFISSCLFMY